MFPCTSQRWWNLSVSGRLVWYLFFGSPLISLVDSYGDGSRLGPSRLLSLRQVKSSRMIPPPPHEHLFRGPNPHHHPHINYNYLLTCRPLNYYYYKCDIERRLQGWLTETNSRLTSTLTKNKSTKKIKKVTLHSIIKNISSKTLGNIVKEKKKKKETRNSNWVLSIFLSKVKAQWEMRAACNSKIWG